MGVSLAAPRLPEVSYVADWPIFNMANPAPAQQRVHPVTGRPFLENENGPPSTEYSVTLTHPRLNNGKPTNVPSIWGGKRYAGEGWMDEEEIVNQALASGKPWQSFSTIEEAEAAAETRSKMLGNTSGGKMENTSQPQQQVGGLGGLGGFMQQPHVQDTLRAVTRSIMTSPSSNWLAHTGQHLEGIQKERKQNTQIADSRDALVGALKIAGFSDEEAHRLANNPAAANLALSARNAQRERQLLLQQRETDQSLMRDIQRGQQVGPGSVVPSPNLTPKPPMVPGQDELVEQPTVGEGALVDFDAPRENNVPSIATDRRVDTAPTPAIRTTPQQPVETTERLKGTQIVPAPKPGKTLEKLMQEHAFIVERMAGMSDAGRKRAQLFLDQKEYEIKAFKDRQAKVRQLTPNEVAQRGLKTDRQWQVDENTGRVTQMGGSDIDIDINSGGPKLPTNHRWLNPDNPDEGVEPLPGSAADPNVMTPTMRNKQAEIIKASSALDAELNEYESLVKKHGWELSPGKDRDSLVTGRRAIQLQMKELFNLGVLNGPDLDLLNELLVDPTSLTTFGGSIFTRDSIKDRAESNIKQLRGIFDRIKKAAIGGNLSRDAVVDDGDNSTENDPLRIRE